MGKVLTNILPNRVTLQLLKKLDLSWLFNDFGHSCLYKILNSFSLPVGF
nr:MAG TPA: hypothetical protein [Bacteriophage sp.]